MSQNRLILHQTEERGGGSVRTQIERGMPPIETSIRKALEAVHSRNFEKKEIPAILSDQFRYRKTHYAYIKEALSKGIGLDDILSFHDEKVEMDLRKLWAPRSGGQKPSKILHVNSSEERSAEILSEGAAADEKGRYSGGAFVVSINVRKESHAPEDFLGRRLLRAAEPFAKSSNALFEALVSLVCLPAENASGYLAFKLLQNCVAPLFRGDRSLAAIKSLSSPP